MKYHLLISALLLAGALIPATLWAGDPPELSANESGVGIKTSSSTFRIPIPLQVNGEKDKTTQKAAVAVDGNVITAHYPGGGVLTISVSNNSHEVAYEFSGFPPNVTGLNFTMKVPMTYKDGGHFNFGEGEMQPFPAKFGKQVPAQGTFKRFTIANALGDGYSMTTPGSYQQIQDHRAFNTQLFSHIIFYKFGNAGSFKFTFEGYTPVPNSKPALKFLVDKFGQSALKDYPGKVTTEAELKADGARQLTETYTPSSKLDSYGGLVGSGAEYGLAKTGFFHVGKANDRLILVTPAGNMFFQLGVCGIASTDDVTKVQGRERIYEWLPEAGDTTYLTAWKERRPEGGNFSFYGANLIRKFGKPFDLNEWSGQVITRLRRWGFNSAGAFSARTAKYDELKFPTVSFLPKVPNHFYLPDKIGADYVIDPYSPGIDEAMDAAYSKLVARANDPLIIGYFQGNEQHFETLPKVISGYKASKVPAKAKLIEVLKAKYGTIGKFNAAWEPAKLLPNWEIAAEEPLFIRTDAASADMKAFFRAYLEACYSLVEKTFHKYDKNHLLIGSRWTPNTAHNEDTVTIGGKYLDVISINYYTDAVEKGFMDKVHMWSGGKAMIFSEWYYGADDQGLAVHKGVKDQGDRAKAYRNFVEQSAALPYVVGSQWFIYTDQSITGRYFSGFNGEGNNTGFVNVADRPYELMVAAATLTHSRIYEVMMGKEKPYVFDDSRFNGKGGAGAGRTKVAVRALPGVKLDGTTTNWPGVPGEPIESSRLVIGQPNPDLRADYRVCWDETNLYFYIQVQDKTPLMNEKSGEGLWSGDGIELFIGSRDLKAPGNLTFSDRQIFLGAGKEAHVHIKDHPEASKNIQCQVFKDVSGEGYVLEAFIPWTALEITPKVGQEFLFDIAVDFSSEGQTRTHQLAWNSTGNISKERSLWGKLKLE
ncbi:MAG: sugar-binding protein [Candidatus Methylacidiphilales bacterium]|nr:sugar-binding protein [Candidatus Methylacidiphilales bacterium]